MRGFTYMRYIKIQNKNSLIEKLAHGMLEVTDEKGNYVETIPPLTSMLTIIKKIKDYWKMNFDVSFISYAYGNTGKVCEIFDGKASYFNPNLV